jgi:hypothetical protein
MDGAIAPPIGDAPYDQYVEKASPRFQDEYRNGDRAWDDRKSGYSGQGVD